VPNVLWSNPLGKNTNTLLLRNNTRRKKTGFDELTISVKKMKRLGKSKVKAKRINLGKTAKEPFEEYKKTKKKTY
jgi:hypothetical protein